MDGDGQTFDCLVFSGGGAKGAYEAGVAKALMKYRKHENVKSELCFVGTSVGALNAAILATSDADRLVEFWKTISNESILGVKRSVSDIGWKQACKLKKGAALYSNLKLRELIKNSVSFGDLAGKHLVVNATDFMKGVSTAFFYSDLVAEFVAEDRKKEPDLQRLQRFVPLEEGNLVNVLLASCAIPLFFPLVRVGDSLFMDGGVGNNTPMSQAALFMRHLSKNEVGMVGDTYCVFLEPGRITLDDEPSKRSLETLLRTYDVYSHIHITPIIRAWDEISENVKTYDGRKAKLLQDIDEMNLLDEHKETVRKLVEDSMRPWGRSIPRLDLVLHKVRPTSSLGPTLDFDQQRIKSNIELGYVDMLHCLTNAGKINETLRNQLESDHVW